MSNTSSLPSTPPRLNPLEALPAGSDLDVLQARLASLSDERAPESPMSPYERARYAHGIVSASGVQPGEALTVALAGVEDTELAAEVAMNAYLRGARLVRVLSDDYLLPELTARLRAQDPQRTPVVASATDALVWHQAFAEDSPLLMINEWRDDPDGLVDQGERENSLRWCLAYWPSPTLARGQGFEGSAGERKLAERLLEFSRNGPDDPLDAYSSHIEKLQERAQALNELALAEVTIATAEGSALRVRLLANSLFQVCDWQTSRGKRFGCNFPTEEIFFTPDPRQTSGRLVSVAPSDIGPFAIASLSGVFRDGRLLRDGLSVAPQDSSQDPEALTDAVYEYLSANPAALRLGEAALVGADSRIGSREERYGINNIDENAGVHVALGDSYLAGLSGLERDGNERNVASDSDGYSLHCDLTLSWGDADVTGLTRSGHEVVLMEKGSWQLETIAAPAQEAEEVDGWQR